VRQDGELLTAKDAEQYPQNTQKITHSYSSYPLRFSRAFPFATFALKNNLGHPPNYPIAFALQFPK
jgi:hypothetical protein